MTKRLIFLTFIVIAALIQPNKSHAQDFDEDNELLEEAEEVPQPQPPGGQNANGEEGATGNAAPAPGRFRPTSRFGNPNNAASRFNSRAGSAGATNAPSAATSSSSVLPGGTATTAGGGTALPLTKSANGKVPFTDAQPEDITKKNFPDVVESFDYRDAPISDVVNAIAALTGKRFIYNENLNGKITISSPAKVTVSEAWELFLTALSTNGYTIVPSGKFLKIRKIEDAKTDALDIYTGSYYPNGDQLITRLIRLKYISAEDTSKTFEKIVKSKSGQVIPYEKTNSLIVTDLGSNIDRMSRIIEELDKPGFEERLKVIPIKNSKAKDLADLIDKIINKGDTKKQPNTFRPASRFGQQEKNESLQLVTPDERTNSLVVVGNQEGLDRIVKLVQELDYPLDPADAGGVYVYYVKHGEAKKIADTLNGIAQEQEKKATSPTPQSNPENPGSFQAPKAKQQLFGGDVIIKADENTNSLIITANKQDYGTVLSILKKIDLAKDQVFVEAYIVEMDAQKTDDWSFNVLQFGGSSNVADADANTLARGGFILGDPQKLSNIATTGGIFGFGHGDKVAINFGGKAIQVPSLLGFIDFIKQNIGGNVLSTPQIMAMDNEEAFIEVGDQIPIGVNQSVTTTGQTSNNIQFADATVLLKLKPFISPDSDVITLQIEQKANDISTKTVAAKNLADSAVGLKKRTVHTNLTLKSGDTAVLGGLMQETDKLTETKIPFLGDIPVLGWLFKSRNTNREKTNLMVFLTPKIIRSSEDHKRLTTAKFTDRIDWVKRHMGGRDPFGEALQPIAKYVESPDEYKLEDQSLSPGAEGVDSQAPAKQNEGIGDDTVTPE